MQPLGDEREGAAACKQLVGRERPVSIAVPVAAIVTLGTVGVLLGADGNGDLRNYHYYGGWAPRAG